MRLSKRGEVNIVATMLIFGIMISALGVLYSQISPTLLGYESRTQSAQQEFIFTTISQKFEELTSATEGSQRRVHIFSEQTIYDVDRGLKVTISILENGVIADDTLTNPITQTANIGRFMAEVNGSFQATTNPSYLNRVFNEDTYINNQTMDNPAEHVIKVEYTFNEANFTMYFRPWVSIVETSPGNWIITIAFVQIDFLSLGDGSAVDFPVKKDEWTLRMRRRNTVVNSFDYTVSPGNPVISIGHTADGTSGTGYTLQGIGSGDSVTVRYLTIPILFTI